MFGIGGVELVIAGALVVGLVMVARYLGAAQWARIDRTVPVGLESTALELPLARLLSDLPNVQLSAGGRDAWTLSTDRAAAWSYIPAVLLFPLGLLFLLFREHATLVVTVRPAEGGSEVHLLGTTRLSVRRVLERALADLPASRRAPVDGPAGR